MRTSDPTHENGDAAILRRLRHEAAIERRGYARPPGTPRTVDDAAPAVGAAQLLQAHGEPHAPPLTGGLAADQAEAGACYQAAFHLASTKGLTYAEGYAYAPTIEAVLPHAWCVDGDGVVADPAWPDASEASYRGVALNLPVVAAVLAAQRVWGVLPNLYLGGFALPRLLRPAVSAGPVTVLTADVDVVQRAYAGR